jgi:hypothetical protein
VLPIVYSSLAGDRPAGGRLRVQNATTTDVAIRLLFFL